MVRISADSHLARASPAMEGNRYRLVWLGVFTPGVANTAKGGPLVSSHNDPAHSKLSTTGRVTRAPDAKGCDAIVRKCQPQRLSPFWSIPEQLGGKKQPYGTAASQVR